MNIEKENRRLAKVIFVLGALDALLAIFAVVVWMTPVKP